MKTLILLSLVILCPSIARAEASLELTKQVEQQVGAIRDALDSRGDAQSCTPGEQASESWFFRNIWIRLTVPTGFNIPGLASFTVVPTFEVLLQRPLPDGWQVYQPAN